MVGALSVRIMTGRRGRVVLCLISELAESINYCFDILKVCFTRAAREGVLHVGFGRGLVRVEGGRKLSRRRLKVRLRMSHRAVSG